MQTIGVTYGYGSRAELEQAAPDVLVDRPSDLLGLLL
jgi:phosphoglycolate phosphatase-like HAD superfamily hydrolase